MLWGNYDYLPPHIWSIKKVCLLSQQRRHKIRYFSQQRDNISLLMIHISFAFLSLSYLRVTPGRGRGAGVSRPVLSLTLATETVPHPSQQDIIRARARRHQQHYLFTCQGPDDNDRGKCANIVPGQRPVTCQVSPGVQPDRYSIFIFKIP